MESQDSSRKVRHVGTVDIGRQSFCHHCRSSDFNRDHLKGSNSLVGHQNVEERLRSLVGDRGCRSRRVHVHERTLRSWKDTPFAGKPVWIVMQSPRVRFWPRANFG